MGNKAFEVEWTPWSCFSGIKAGTECVRVFLADGIDSLEAAIDYGLDECVDFLPLGKGTNFIGSDHQIANAAVIMMRNRKERKLSFAESGDVIVDASVPLRTMILEAAKSGYGGMAALSGIPGTVGGALAMNAGANKCDIAQFVAAMDGIDLRNGSKWRWQRNEPNHSEEWGYRSSPVPQHVILTTAELHFSRVRPEDELYLIELERKRRLEATPRGLSCGSVFKNPPQASAGQLLDQAGCKGLSVGAFSVSEQHANWIVNLTGKEGAAEDCKRLVAEMRRRVQGQFGVELTTEWRFADDYA